MPETVPAPTGIAVVCASLRATLGENPAVAAAGLFGSALRGDTWEHSDIDVFVILHDAEPERVEGLALGAGPMPVHVQLWTLSKFRAATARDRGSPLFEALSGVEVWFDHAGDLRAAVVRSREFGTEARALAGLRALGAAVETLHSADKHVRFGRDEDARSAHGRALEQLVGASLAELGKRAGRAPRDDARRWKLPEADALERLEAGGDVGAGVAQTWARVRSTLVLRCQPLLERIRQPETAASMLELPELAGATIPDRLLHELCAAGALERAHVRHPILGLPEVRYQRASPGTEEPGPVRAAR